MLTNVKAKKRLVQAIIAVLALCLVVTGASFLLNDAVRQASAQNLTYTVTSASSWNTAVNNTQIQNGDNVTINVTADFNAGGKLTAFKTGANYTVNMGGHTIYWDIKQGSRITDTSYTSGNYASGTYWGMITIPSGANVTFTGRGTIRNLKIGTASDGSGRGDYPQRAATIVNNGNLTIDTGVTVAAYLSNIDTSSYYKDAFLYCVAIYNTGTVNTSGNIDSGTMVSSYSGSTNSYHYAIGYGIYGGTVNVNGGSINVDAYSGGMKAAGTCSEGNQMVEIAVGVYSSTAKILGNTNITTNTLSWQSQSGNDNWGNKGVNIMFSAGVMYLKGANNYPVIGPGVNITATYKMNNKETVYVPGAPDLYYSGLYCDDEGPHNWSRKAFAVVGVDRNVNTIGSHTTEKTFDSDGGFFGSISNPGDSGNNNHIDFAGTESYYRTEESYLKYPTSTGANYLVNASGIIQTATSRKDLNLYAATFRNGTPTDVGAQYVTVYRYYDNGSVSGVPSRITFDYDSNIQTGRANVLVNNATSYNGYIDGSNQIKWGAGGASRNERVYKFQSQTLTKLASSAYVSRDKTNPGAWTETSDTGLQAGTTVGADQVGIVYLNYVKQNATRVRVAAASMTDPAITDNSPNDTTNFTVEYTGATIVPGKDFRLEVIDMGGDPNFTSNYPDDDTIVSGRYNINPATSVANTISLSYRYSTDGGSTWTNGLPKDAGDYIIEVTVPDDLPTNSNMAVCGNRYGISGNSAQHITAHITKAKPTITGANSANGTYGQTYDQIINFSSYILGGKGSDVLTGSWSIAGVDKAKNPYPDATAAAGKQITLVWTPNATTAKNYEAGTYEIMLNVARRTLYVSVGTNNAVEVGKDASTIDWQFVYSGMNADNDPDFDKIDRWNNTSNIQIQVGNTWQAYSSAVNEGTYPARIVTFGGAGDTNNIFVLNKDSAGADKYGSLEVGKAQLVYRATATPRAYDPASNEVDVTLTYVSGATDNDLNTIAKTLTVKGTVDNNGAGTRTVHVDTSSVTIPGIYMGNYILIIEDTTVVISKAVPPVSATANPATVTYDPEQTLNDIALVGTGSVSGTWEWKAPDTVPTADVSEYTAVFTPTGADADNYEPLEVKVTLTVEKMTVYVGVPTFHLTYGNALPGALSGMIGYYSDGTLTQRVDLSGVATSGSVSAEVKNPSTNATIDFRAGQAVGTYNIVITSALTATNYKFVAVNSNLIVDKRQLTIRVNNKTITYGDSMPTFTVADLTATGFYSNQSLNSLSGEPHFTCNYRRGDNAGTYAVSVTGYTSNNYDIVYVDGSLIVQKAVLTVTPSAETIEYGEYAPDYYNDGKYTIAGDDGVDLKNSISIQGMPVFTTRNYTSGSGVGTYTVDVNTSDMLADNYDFIGGTATLRVIKATPYVDQAPNASLLHAQLYSEAVFTDDAIVVNPHNDGLSVEGTFALQNATTRADYASAGGTLILVPAVFTPEDTINYNTVELNVLLDIREIPIEGQPVITGSPMVGQTLTASVATMTPDSDLYYNYQWYLDGVQIDGETSSSYVVRDGDKGHSLTVTVTAKFGLGYYGSAPSEPTSKIVEYHDPVTKAQLNITLPETSVYDKTERIAVVEATDEALGKIGKISIKYNGSSTAPTKAGTYTVTVDVDVPEFTDENTDYYGPVSGLVVGTFSITRKPVTINVQAEGKIYDGSRTANVTIYTEGFISGDVVAVSDVYTARFDSPNVNVDGQGNVIPVPVTVSGLTLTGTDASNYSVSNATGEAIISKRTLKAEVLGVSRDYDPNRNDVVLDFINVSGYASIDNPSTVYFANGYATLLNNAHGEQNIYTDQITYDLLGSSAGNYEPDLTIASTVYIAPATPSPAIPELNVGVYNAGYTLGYYEGIFNYMLEDDLGTWSFDKDSEGNDIVPTVSVKRYAATYTPKSGDYKTIQAEITVNVDPRPIVLRPDNQTVVYGSPIPTFKVNYDNLVNDSPDNIPGTGVTVVTDYVPGADVGSTYYIHVTYNFDTDNYTFATQDANLTVIPATLTVQATAENKEYDGLVDNIHVTFEIIDGLYAADTDLFVSPNDIRNGVAASPEAGITTVSYVEPTITGLKASNYNVVFTPASGVLTVEIYKKSLGYVEFPTEGQVQFGYDLTHATFATPGDTSQGTFAYENAKAIIPEAVGVYNNYLVVFTPYDSRNYESQTQIVTLTVVKAKLDYIVGIVGTPQDGQVLSVAITGMPTRANDYIHYQWYRISEKGEISQIIDANTNSYTATSEDIGYTILVLTFFDSDAPYEFADTADVIEIDDLFGIFGETSGFIQQIKLSFWQRILDWIRRIIAAITGIKLTVSL